MVRWLVVWCVLLALLVSGCQRDETTTDAAATQETVTLSYANFPPATTFPCVQMEHWKEQVEQDSGGSLAINTFPGGTLLGAKDMLAGVIAGQADIGCLCMSYQPGAFPMTTVTELPLGFKSSTVASSVLWDLYQKYQPKEFAQVKVLAMFTSAPTCIMSQVPVRSLEDLAGLELRASGIASQILDKLGATPVSMPMSQTPEALQKGLVKGLLSSMEVLKDLNFAEYCRYETLTNFQVYPFAVVMNLEKWNSLSAQQQEVLTDLSREQALWTGRYMDAHVADSLKWASETYQIEQINLSEQDQVLAEQKMEPLLANWHSAASSRGIDADAVMADVLRLKTQAEHTLTKGM
ncbi:MAG: C4-dicarboxylate ABC transporter substrate-binding protein [Desulfuromonadales bacterium C00003068]|jgi:TRAP-type C4-dicarboxylate transport system substrate-binding protein|nr:MAG: C4-dicarboxylate ABC transporter substrate-binding protein [Desulfuromonadales bacterium C00003068]